MSQLVIVDLVRHALLIVLLLSGPLMLVALVVGLLVGVIQAVTSIQEQTLSFVPKILAAGGVLLLMLPWLLQQVGRYFTELFRGLPSLLS